VAHNSKIDGSNVLYHYLQKDLYKNDIWFFQMLIARLVASLGIWFNPSLYQNIPLLRPYAVRDSTCRKRNNPEGIEQWGCANESGYFRDDNSLLKGIPSSLKISSPLKELYNGRCIGTGFVASHIWRSLDHSRSDKSLATQDPWTYSFVPNLVWLPEQVAKLTDREGSFSQIYLQALSVSIYRDLPVAPVMQPFVKEAWSRLPISDAIPKQGLPKIDELSFFNDEPSFRKRRIIDIESVSIAIQRAIEGKPLEKKVVSSRYSEGLCLLDSEALKPLGSTLAKYLEAVLETITSDKSTFKVP
jgi:hypothetical protein